jgi:hypothetical protein
MDIEDIIRHIIQRYKSSGKVQLSADEEYTLEQQILSSCPRAGDGINNWLPYAKCALDWLAYKDEDIRDKLSEAVLAAGRKPRTDEIERVIHNIKFMDLDTNSDPRGKTRYRVEPRKKLLDLDLSGSLEDLYEESSIEEPWELPFWDPIERLFSGELVLCFANHKFDKGTSHLVKVSSLRRFKQAPPFIVPNPVIGKGGLTKEGNFSCRAIVNFRERHYIVTEWDAGSLDEQAQKILWLREKGSLKLRMVDWSGSRSLQAWWECRGLSEVEVMKFFGVALSVGACEGPKTINQLVRTPNAINEDKSKRQSVVYL